MFVNFFIIILGFVFLMKGADFLVDGSSTIAKKFNIREIVIGLTIVSIGTSMPELMVSLTSGINNHSDIAIGNVVGSNISNLFLILGICAIIKPLKFQEETVRLEIPLVIFLTALLYIVGNNSYEKIITQKEGIILVIFFILFILYNIFMSKKGCDRENNKFDINRKDIIKAIFKIIIGIIGLKFGGDFVVNNASEIASKFGVSEKIISLTIVAISTSLPELITSINATLKGEINLAIGNVIGSNIFNIVLIVGATSIITPIQYSISYNRDIIFFMIGILILAFLPMVGKKRMSRFAGMIYLISYLMYMAYIIYSNYNIIKFT